MNQTEESDFSEMMLNKENHVVVWRWLATVIDICVMIGFLLTMRLKTRLIKMPLAKDHTMFSEL